MNDVKELAAELAGVLYDVDSGTGFDVTCRNTVQYVKNKLENYEMPSGVTASTHGEVLVNVSLPVEAIGASATNKESLELLLTNICFHAENVADEDVIHCLLSSLEEFVYHAGVCEVSPVNASHLKRLKAIRASWKADYVE